MSASSESESGQAPYQVTEDVVYDETEALGALPNSGSISTPVNIEEATLFLRALSNENRLALLTLLQSGEQTVTVLANTLNMRQPAVSQQLGRLREANLVEFRREGKTVYYRLTSNRVRAFLPLIKNHFTVED